MKRLTCIMISLLCISFISCDGLFRLTPELNNPFDPENETYTGVSADIPTGDLTAEYLFDGTTEDTGGNGNDITGGSLGGYSSNRFGESNKAIAFDGTDEYLVLPDPNVGNFTSTARTTISLWFKAPEAEGTLVACGRYADTDTGWALRITPGDYSYTPYELTFVYADKTEDVGYNLINEKWHHLVIAGTPDGIILYIDGSFTSGPFAQAKLSWPDAAGEYFYLGAERVNNSGAAEDIGTFFTGWTDDIRIYSQNLTQEEIYSLLLEGLL